MSQPPVALTRGRTVRLALQTVAVAVILFFLGRILLRRWDEVSPSLTSARIDLLLVSLVVLVPAHFASALGWHWVLRMLGERHRALPSLRVFFWAQLAKYVPGHFWHLVGRVYLGRRLNVGTGTSIISLYLEAVLIVGSAGVVSLPGLVWPGFPLHARLAAGALLLATLVAMLHPSVLFGVLRVLRRPRREGPTYSWRRAYALIPLYTSIWVVHGVAFTIFVGAFSPVGADDLLPLTAALAAAFVIGFVTPLAPAGIGVREGVLSVLLAQVVSMPMAVLLALTSRLWFMVAEAISTLLVSLVPAAGARPPRGDRP